MKKQLLFLFLIFTNYVSKSQPDIQWQKCYGGSSNDNCKSILQTLDGGFIMTGQTASSDSDVSLNQGGYDCWIVKTNLSGDIEWQKSFGGTNDDIANSIQQTKDGGYIVACSTASNDGDVIGNYGRSDCWILKLDET